MWRDGPSAISQNIGQERRDQPVHVVLRGFDVHVEPELLRGVARDRSDRDDSRSRREALGSAERIEEVADRRGAGESDVVGACDCVELLGVEPTHAVMVGDTIADDIEGAVALGMRAILVDREGVHEDFEPRIATLNELPPLVGL